MASYKDVDYSYLGVEGLHGDYMVRVSNLSRKRIMYTLPELNLARDFRAADGSTVDTKTVSFHELYLLNNSPGGPKLIWDNLQIRDNDVRHALGLPEDPEFDYTYKEIKELIETGTEEEILDALDFGPFFIASQMKAILVTETPKIDYNKIRFFEGLFRTKIETLKDNFDWSKGDEVVGDVYKAMDKSKPAVGRASRQRRAGAPGAVEQTEQPATRTRRAGTTGAKKTTGK